MAQSIYDLVTDCTVRITAGNSQGSGFFVAPGLVLTCAHVIEPAQQGGEAIQCAWQGKTYPAEIYAYRDVAYPDLALLKVGVPNHPCVLLAGSAEPFSNLYSYGYGDKEPGGASTTFACEGWAGPQNEQIKFKDGQVRPGMSGSPVLNYDTGSVCGIVQSSRDRSSALGGKALLTSVIFREFPELEKKQQEFHTQDKRWSDALSQAQRQKLGLGWLPTPTVTGTIEVFFSYAHKDEDLKDDIVTALALMRRQKLIENWFDREITAGQQLDQNIAEHLEKARIILLLVSRYFMASDYCYDTEMMRAMQRHTANTARVIPVILSPCDWHDAPFGRLKALPKDGKPITTWSNRDEAFLDVAKELRRVVEDLTKPLQ